MLLISRLSHDSPKYDEIGYIELVLHRCIFITAISFGDGVGDGWGWLARCLDVDTPEGWNMLNDIMNGVAGETGKWPGDLGSNFMPNDIH